MPFSEISPHLRGPWRAVLADREGFTFKDFATAVAEYGEDHDDEMTVAVVRGTALPIDQLPGDDFSQLPGVYNSADKVFEVDVWLVDPDDVGCGAEARFAQALAMAAGLNAVSIEQNPLDSRPSLSQGGAEHA